MSNKKLLRAITLTGVIVLVTTFAFVVTFGFTSSSTLAQQILSSPPPPIPREVYRVTANEGDVSIVNIRQKLDDGSCRIIGNIKVNTIVAIRGISSDDTIECYNDEGVKIRLYRLSEDSRRTKRYIAANNVVPRSAKDAFNDEGKAKIVSPKGVNLRDENCNLLNQTDKTIPKALKKGDIVSVSDLNNIKTKICGIEIGFTSYRFEMVEVNFEYKVNGETRTVTGYVAQEFLMPAPKTT